MLGCQQALEVATAVTVAVAVFVASVPALRAYQVADLPALLVACAVVPIAVAFTTARLLRWPAPWSYLTSAAALALTLLIADGPHPLAVARAFARGPNHLLTETLPLTGSRISVSALVVLVWVAGAATSESLIRTGGARPRPPYALAIPVALYVVCFAAATAAPGRDRLAGPLLLLAVASTAVLRLAMAAPPTEPEQAEGRAPSRFRSALTGVVLAAAVALVLALVAPSVPALAARPATVHRQPPTVIPVITDPVDTMAQLRDDNPRAAPVQELSASFSAPSTGYLSLAYLDSYDGARWQFAATFQPTGGRVPLESRSAPLVSNGTVSQRIAITGSLPVPLLPALDRPETITGLDAVTDPVSGMLLPQQSTAHPVYTALSVAPDVTVAQLSPADGIEGAIAQPADRVLPPDTSSDLATTLRFLSSLTGTRPTASVGFLQSTLQVLQTKEKRIDPVASAAVAPVAAKGHATTTTTAVPAGAGGTSLSEVINAVTVNRAATPEQFATFYAMVARYLGVPARVVTGFRLSNGPSPGLMNAGTYRVTNRQAWAWVEIPVQGFGWVICDPTPNVATAAAAPPPETVQTPVTTVPPRAANVVPHASNVGGHAVAPHVKVRVPHHHSTPVWVWVLIGLGAVLLLALLAGPGQAFGRRAIRRRRRRSADPAHLAVGAWLELLDGLDRSGMRTAVGATASEVADEVGHHFGSELVPSVQAIGQVVDRAVFSSRTAVAVAEADQCWSGQQAIRKQIESGLDRRQRLRASLLVGSAPAGPVGRGQDQG
ncbi:MAG TPA: transglutaminaseTgpA domain-containing protein [Acidimicrobiales bacterium]|nr:transglutaminaseTgpA domain-containing protein [Acidimicrobiales bacterium]